MKQQTLGETDRATRLTSRGPRLAAGRGFTLVELLVVIGIIALLVSILLPSLGRVREQARQTKCLSNIRQLGLAFTMYVNESKGRFPFRAVWGNAAHDEDWIWWQTVPVTGRPVCDPSQSAIAKYLGNFDAQYFLCPSDNPDRRNSVGVGGPYLYSYSMNHWLAGDNTSCPRISLIVNSSEKILLVEESELTINDGDWNPPLFDVNNVYVTGTGSDLLRPLHDHKPAKPDSGYSPLPNPDLRGNVLFIDGHAEYVDRQYAHYVGHVMPLEN